MYHDKKRSTMKFHLFNKTTGMFISDFESTAQPYDCPFLCIEERITPVGYTVRGTIEEAEEVKRDAEQAIANVLAETKGKKWRMDKRFLQGDPRRWREKAWKHIVGCMEDELETMRNANLTIVRVTKKSSEEYYDTGL